MKGLSMASAIIVLVQLAPEAEPEPPEPPDIPGIGFEPLPEPDGGGGLPPELDGDALLVPAVAAGGCEAPTDDPPDAGWLARLVEPAGAAVDEPLDEPLGPPAPLPDPAWPPADEPPPTPVAVPDPPCAPMAPSLLAGAAVSC